MPNTQEMTNTVLKQLENHLFLTDGGLETTLVFHDQIDLPYFAAFDLLKDDKGRERLKAYFSGYADIAAKQGYGFVFESVTWRASADWGGLMGLSQTELDAVNKDAIELLHSVRDGFQEKLPASIISGCIGPRGDGYSVETSMSASEAEAYHMPQIKALQKAGADIISALTMTNMKEAIGIVRACQKIDIPVVISFTVETDGSLPCGETLATTISTVDKTTQNGPVYYMINCAHPTHFSDVLNAGADWVSRIKGVRANASCLSHEELDNAEDLDEGNPEDLAAHYKQLLDVFSHVNVIGGCCGTDERHIGEIGRVCAVHQSR